MNRLLEHARRIVRGRRASRLLAACGIDARRYWLLMDLFSMLSERGEMMDQLGRNGVALQGVSRIYGVFFGLMGVLMLWASPAPEAYSGAFLTLTGVLMLAILLSETGNSLVNPVEALVLAHQPVDGATYTAAKLSHLASIVLYIVVAMNAVPALLGLALPHARWSFPIVHLAAALAIGTVAGLLCCALYGWLIRFLPARRLKAAGQLAGTVPLLAMMWWGPVQRLLARAHLRQWLPAEAALRTGLVAAAGVVALAAVWLGLRSLSADYLIRVSGIVHGGGAKVRGRRRSWLGAIAARRFGGQPGRAGYAFVSCMMRRDFQFRRQAAQTMVFAVVAMVPVVAQGWRIDPFSGRFTTAHLLPHFLGFVLCGVATILSYGNDPKGAWIFLLASPGVFGGFARGIYGALWMQLVAIPQLVLLAVFAWPWGVWHAALFTGYSLAVTSFYLALVVRLIEGMPFSSPLDPSRQPTLLPLLVLGGLAATIVVGLQYFLVFRSAAIAAAVGIAIGAAAWMVARRSVAALEESIRNSIAAGTGEAALYTEVN